MPLPWENNHNTKPITKAYHYFPGCLEFVGTFGTRSSFSPTWLALILALIFLPWISWPWLARQVSTDWQWDTGREDTFHRDSHGVFKVSCFGHFVRRTSTGTMENFYFNPEMEIMRWRMEVMQSMEIEQKQQLAISSYQSSFQQLVPPFYPPPLLPLPAAPYQLPPVDTNKQL